MEKPEREAVRGWLKEGTLVYACDASVVGNQKAVAVWFGIKFSEEGVVITSSVQGLSHDLGIAEMMGPVIVMEVLQEIKEESGVEGDVVIWSDSAETVGLCNDGVLKHLPSRSVSRNMDLKIKWNVSKEKYRGKLRLRKVEAHQDDGTKYKDLSFEARINIDCDKFAG